MALINQNSLIGITSITSPSASNVLTVHTNDTTERLRVTTDGLSFSGTNASLDTSGNLTVGGNVSVGGTLTYEDVTNIDAVGIITAQAGIRVTGGSVGVGTATPATLLEVGNQSKTISAAITVSSGEILGGGTGPVISLKHGPAGGTQRTHQIYSYIGDLRIVADSNENMEFHTGGSERLRIASAGEIFVGGSSTYNVIANYVNTAKLHLSGAGNGSANIELYGSNHASDPKIMTVTTNNSERLRIDSSGHISQGGGTTPASSNGAIGLKYGIKSSANNVIIGETSQSGAGYGLQLESRQTGRGNPRIAQIGLRNDSSGNGEISLMTSPNGADVSERLRITSDGSTYTGGSIITESDMNWGHDAYQRPHIFTGQSGGNPADAAVVLASPETNPSATRIGSLVFGCKTSSTSGVINSGLKAVIDCSTNTNVSDAWKTGARIDFKTRLDNGYLVLAQSISSAGEVTKPKQPGFYARRSIGGDGRAEGAQEWTVSGTGSYNEGGHFKTSGGDAGKFVAPVTGKYYFAAQPGYKQTGSNFNFYFRINGSNVAEPVRIIDGGDDLTSHSGFTGSCVIHLTAGQKFDVYIGNTHHVNLTLNYFCGYLMG